MSAFICSDEHFDAIYSALYGRMHKDRWAGTLRHILTRSALLSDEKVMETVLGWRALNVEAVNYRYSEQTQAERDYSFGAVDDGYRPTYRMNYAAMSDARLFGLLSCLVYQCTEGEHLEQDPRYKTLTAIQQRAAANVAEAHQDFVWTIEGAGECRAEVDRLRQEVRARIKAERLAGELRERLTELSEWMRERTGPADGTQDMLTRAHYALAKARGEGVTS